MVVFSEITENSALKRGNPISTAKIRVAKHCAVIVFFAAVDFVVYTAEKSVRRR